MFWLFLSSIGGNGLTEQDIMKNHYVVDYETLSNCFIACFEHYSLETNFTFIVHEKLNHLPQFIEFLERNKRDKEWHISYNGLGFDAQITEFVLRNKEILLECTPKEAVSEIYHKAQQVIERQTQKQFQEYSEKDFSIPQIDVFKLNHWDNPAKMSSLKWIQYSIDWFNLQEMPIHHSREVDNFKDINLVKDYCCNDVKSTKKIMELCSDQINLRGTLTGEYNIPLFCASEPRISKELFLLFLNRITGIPKYELRQLRTRRNQIVVKDILLPYIKFERPEFQGLLEAYKKLIIDPQKIKGSFKYEIEHKGVHTEYGLGGLHGATKSGIYEETEDMIIMTSDVKQLRPNSMNCWKSYCKRQGQSQPSYKYTYRRFRDYLSSIDCLITGSKLDVVFN